jgi:DNA-binding transcriptional LysR family regulator
MLNIHHLELFYHVARAGGITAALRRIPYGIQQPAVSAQLSALEAAVGQRLFERRPFALTEAGATVLEHVAPFFEGLPLLEERLRTGAAQRLRLAASDYVLREEVPRLLERYMELVPEAQVTLREANQEKAERLFREGEIDVALHIIERRAASGLCMETLARLPLALLVKEQSVFRRATDVFRGLKHAELPLISVPRSAFLSEIFHEELRRRGLDWAVRLEAGTLPAVEQYVARGFGIGLALEILGQSPERGVRRLRLRGFPRLEFGVAWRPPSSAQVERFIELVRGRARTLEAVASPS